MAGGPTPAWKKVRERTGLTVQDMNTIELNEAFPSQAIEVIGELPLPMERTNPNGSGISLGHPVGATGCILGGKALYELRRTRGRFSLATLCLVGGPGIAGPFHPPYIARALPARPRPTNARMGHRSGYRAL